MPNQFFVEPPNPLQALMTGMGAYQQTKKAGEEAAQKQALQQAMPMIQSGDYKGALATLMGSGNIQGATAVGSIAQQQAAQQHMTATEQQATAQLAESSRHNKASEGIQYNQASTAALAPVKIGSTIAGDIYAVRDPKSQGGYRIIDPNALSGGAQPQPGGAPQPGSPQAGGEPLTGQAFLDAKVPPAMHPLITKIANYEMDPKTSSITGGHREKVLSAVAQFDPTYDAAQFPSRQAAVKAFATGPQGNTVRSFDVAISHMDTGRELVKAMGNGDVQMVNKLSNAWKEQTGSPAPTNFDAAKEIIGDEIVKAVVGSNSQAFGDRQAIKENLKRASSPQQLLGVLDTYTDLMAGQVKGIKKQYEDTTRMKNFDSRLSPATLARLQKSTDSHAAGDPLTQARAAIQAGADPNAVRQRLQQNNIDPSGL